MGNDYLNKLVGASEGYPFDFGGLERMNLLRVQGGPLGRSPFNERQKARLLEEIQKRYLKTKKISPRDFQNTRTPPPLPMAEADMDF